MNTPTAGSRPAPLSTTRLTSAAWAIGGICLLLGVAARTTGAGWLVVIMCLLAGGLVIGVVWPHLSLIGMSGQLHAPGDAVAGQTVDMTLTLRRARLGTLVRINDGELHAVFSDCPATITMDGLRRGVVDAVPIQVLCGAPFGIFWARRKLRLPLERPLFVAPRTAEATLPQPPAGAGDGDMPQGPLPRAGEQLRSVRDYQAGDPMRLVHWPATARRGELIVKELEAPARLHMHISVELTGEIDEDDAICEHAMGLILAALDDGVGVSLGTVGPDGTNFAVIDGMRPAGRQLALARPGRCPQTGWPPHAHVVHLRSGHR